MTLVDTSAWVEALRRDGSEAVRRHVAELLTAGGAALCPMVVLELGNGAGDEEERAKIRRLVDELPSLEVTAGTWELAASLARSCRTRGVTVPPTDLVIAATARTHGAGLLHADRHFDLIDETEAGGGG